jgi:hypothetical protein
MYPNPVVDIEHATDSGNDILDRMFHAALGYRALERRATMMHLDTDIAGIHAPLGEKP